MAGKKLGLFVLAVTKRVHAQLAQEQRAIAHEVLQTEQITLERLGVMEIDVEGGEVEKRKIEVLRRGIVGVGDQALRIDLLDDVAQLGQEPLDLSSAVPTDDIGRDFVADAVGEQGGVPAAALGGFTHGQTGFALRPFAVEEAEVL